MALIPLAVCMWACGETEPRRGLECMSYGLPGAPRDVPVLSIVLMPCPVAARDMIDEVRSGDAFTTNADVVRAEAMVAAYRPGGPPINETADAFIDDARVRGVDGGEVGFGYDYDVETSEDGDDVTLTFRTSGVLPPGVATIESSFLDDPLPFHAGADAAPFVHRIELNEREGRRVFVLTFSEPLELGPDDVQVRSLGDEVTEAEVVGETLPESRVEVVEVQGDEPTQPYELLISRRVVSEASGLPVQWEAPEGFGLPEAVVGANVEAVEADEEWLRVRVAPTPGAQAYVVLDAVGVE
jgi:hypothetical protein